MIVFDTTAFSLAFVAGATASSRKTKKPIKYAKERIDALIERIAKDEDVIVIPAPVLSEVLVKIPTKVDELLKHIRSSPWFKVEAFDSAAAVELGLRTAKAMAAGDKREGLQADWTKVKFDRQILAIALVAGASEVISDDGDIIAIGERWGLQVSSVEDLPIPAELIPPPLLAALEDDEDETTGQAEQDPPEPCPTVVSGSGEAHPKGEGGAEDAEGKADDGKEAEKA